MSTAPVQAGAPGNRPAARTVAAWLAVPLAGSALLGLLAGYIWGEIAPRAQLQAIGAGAAQLVHTETTAFIVADAWFCGIGAAAGLVAGVLGYRFLLTPRAGARAAGGVRAAATAGLILGGVAGALVMLWVGQQIGLSGYDHQLAASPDGTLFRASLTLGAKSALVFWPMVTAIVILASEWGTRHPADRRVQHADGSAAGRPSS